MGQAGTRSPAGSSAPTRLGASGQRPWEGLESSRRLSMSAGFQGGDEEARIGCSSGCQLPATPRATAGPVIALGGRTQAAEVLGAAGCVCRFRLESSRCRSAPLTIRDLDRNPPEEPLAQPTKTACSDRLNQHVDVAWAHQDRLGPPGPLGPFVQIAPHSALAYGVICEGTRAARCG
jgi:hypothetical protein